MVLAVGVGGRADDVLAAEEVGRAPDPEGRREDDDELVDLQAKVTSCLWWAAAGYCTRP